MYNFITDFSIYLNQKEYAKTENVDISYYHNNLKKIFSIENTENGICCLYNTDGELFLIKDVSNIQYLDIKYQFTNRELVKIEYDTNYATIINRYMNNTLMNKEIHCCYKNVDYTKYISYYDNGNPRLMYYECSYDRETPKICHNNVPCRIKFYENGYTANRRYRIVTKDVKSVVKIKDSGFSFKQLNNSLSRITTKKSLMEMNLKVVDSLIKGVISKDEYYIIKDIIESKMLIYTL